MPFNTTKSNLNSLGIIREEVLLDVAELATGEKQLRVGTFLVNPDHTRAAYTIDEGGEGEFSIRLRDLSSRKALGDLIRGATDNIAWSADGAFLYAGGRYNPIRRWAKAGRGPGSCFVTCRRVLERKAPK